MAIKHMGFTQDGTVSSVNVKPLEFVDYFTYLGSNITFAKQ